jgi:leader peptidase (prepilin peptidase) / N-methyltransferase
VGDVDALTRALGGSVLSTSVCALVALWHPGGLGWGDVKLQAVLGFYLGWLHPVLVVGQVLGSFVLGGVVALVLVLFRQMAPTDHVAFGPFMIAATWLMVLGGKIGEII